MLVQIYFLLTIYNFNAFSVSLISILEDLVVHKGRCCLYSQQYTCTRIVDCHLQSLLLDIYQDLVCYNNNQSDRKGILVAALMING